MTDDIGKLIEDTINNLVVRDICKIDGNMTRTEKYRHMIVLGQVINYCILFKSNDGIIDYLSSTNKEEYLINKVSSMTDDINEFAYNNFVVDGYSFHATNSFFGEKILKYGLSPKYNGKEEFINDVVRISAIYDKYGKGNPLGWSVLDLLAGKTGWFSDSTPFNVTYYSNGPEWFGHFCGDSCFYFGLVDDDKRNGYYNRNYEDTLECVEALIRYDEMNDRDSKEVLEFFNKYWNLFENSKPWVIMIPNKLLYDVNSYDNTNNCYDIIASGRGVFANDNCHYKYIPGSELNHFDLSSVVQRKEWMPHTGKYEDDDDLQEAFDFPELGVKKLKKTLWK